MGGVNACRFLKPVHSRASEETVRLSTEDLDTLLQVQLAMALLSKLTYDVTRDTGITLEETAAAAPYAWTYLDQWLDRVHDAPIGELC